MAHVKRDPAHRCQIVDISFTCQISSWKGPFVWLDNARAKVSFSGDGEKLSSQDGSTAVEMRPWVGDQLREVYVLAQHCKEVLVA